jgi:starvation-inducible DNA-binding protein
VSRADQRQVVELQRELRDLLCLAVAGDHVRWVVVGDDGELAAWLADAVPEWRALADQVAKRLASMGAPPDGRLRSLAEDIPVNWVPDGWLSPVEGRRLLTTRLRTLALWARQRGEQASDPESACLLDAVSAGLEHAP